MQSPPIKVIDIIEPLNTSRQKCDLLIGLVIAACVTASLLWIMQYLIASGQKNLIEAHNTHSLNFVYVKPEESLRKKNNRPRKPPIPKSPPAEPLPPMTKKLKLDPQRMTISNVPVVTDIDLHGGFSLSVGEGDYLPIIKIAPLYPRRAQSRGIEGQCTVQYTVTREGTTRDVSVVEAECSSRLFKTASIKAALQFKYKPRIVDGQAIEVKGVRNRFNYKLEKSK